MLGISWLWASGATTGCSLVGLRGRGAGVTACLGWPNGFSIIPGLFWGESSRSNSASTSPELSTETENRNVRYPTSTC